MIALAILTLVLAGCASDDDDSDEETPLDDDASDDDATLDDDSDDDDLDDDGAPPYPETCEDGPELTFDLAASPNVAPYPSDLYVAADSASPSGVRLRLDATTPLPVGKIARANLLGFLVRAYEQATGYSPLADAYLPVGEEPDAATLPDEIDPSTGDAVFLMVDDPASDFDGELAPIRIEWRASDLRITPWRPLRERTRYALVATRALTTGGECYRASASMRSVWSARSGENDDGAGGSLADALDRLAERGFPAENVLSLSSFTTMHATRDLEAAARVLAEYAEDHPPAFYDWEIVDDASSELWATAHATVDVPIFQDADGAWTYDADGEPTIDHVEPVRVFFVLPAIDAHPDGAPWPMLLFEHGIFNDKHEMRAPFTTHAAQTGFAIAAADGVCHGDRLPPGMGEVGQFLCFFNLLRPDVIRDNFRETVTDTLWIARALRTLGDTDLDEDETPDFDTTHIANMGMSFGSIVAGSVLALDPELDANVLAASGAKFASIILEGEAAPYFEAIRAIEGILAPGEPVTDFLHLVMHVMQTILDPADPANFVARAMNKPLDVMDGIVPTVLQQGSAYDETIGGPPGGWLCRSGGWPQLEPFAWDVGATHASAPYEGSAFYQFDTEEHTLIFDDDALGAAARDQILHFLRTNLDTGTGEVIDPLAP
ncbi:MAG: hypothetical protein KJ042_03600 [Deltaproteobacteria bacterium]|nr:hypothetical protein [Deltaproteobacteria bacterium]